MLKTVSCWFVNLIHLLKLWHINCRLVWKIVCSTPIWIYKYLIDVVKWIFLLTVLSVLIGTINFWYFNSVITNLFNDRYHITHHFRSAYQSYQSMESCWQNPSKKVYYWLRKPATVEFIDTLNAKLKVDKMTTFKIYAGKHGGTYAHWQIFLAYACEKNPHGG